MSRPRTALRLGAALATVIASAGVAIAAAAPAAADSSGPIVSITALPVPGNPTIHRDLFSDGANAKVWLASVTRGLTVAGTNQLDGSAYNITITPPAGGSLAPGFYPVRTDGRGASTPSMPAVSVMYENGGGGPFLGDVDIRDLGWTASGAITRFDIAFAPTRGEYVPSFSGELRMGQAENGSVDLSARTLTWNETPLGYPRRVLTEWLRNAGPTPATVGTAAIGGDAARDFAVSSDGCSGRTLAAGATCSLGIGYTPTAAGPRIAQLTVPVAGVVQTVALSSTTSLGTTSITTSGADELDQGTTQSLAAGAGYMVDALTEPAGYVWTTHAASGVDDRQLITSIGTATGVGPLVVGSHRAVSFTTATGDQYGESTSVDARACGSSTGTVDVKAFALDAFGVPSLADITFTQRCIADAATMSGTLLWHWRTDVTAPTAPTSLAIGGGTAPTVSWRPSASSDLARTIVRVVEGDGRGATPLSGYPVSAGSAVSASLPALPPNSAFTVVAFSVDTTGNVSSSASASFTSGGTTAPVVLAGAPTAVTAVAGDGSATVSFRPPVSSGSSPITGYVVQTSTGAPSVSATTSPVVVPGLRNGSPYSFSVAAVTAAGRGPASLLSNTVTPHAAVPSSSQLLPDPGFESGTGGWAAFVTGKLTRVTSPVHSGSAALTVAATSSAASLVGLTQNSAAASSVAGRGYSLSCWVRPSASGLRATARLLEYTQDFATVTHLPSTTTAALPAGTWTRVFIAGVAAKSGERIVPQIYSADETTSTGTITYDDCTLTAG